MDEWPITTIEALGEVFDGPHATPKTVSEGPIFLGIGALQDGRINLGETRHVTPEDYEKWTKRVRPKAGDIVFSYETRLGQAAIIPKGMVCCLGRRMGLVRVDRRKMLPRFFLYNYISPRFQEFLRSRTIHGATVDRLSLTEFPNFPFPCPPIEDQQRITSLLGALDDKIEVNRRTNETLEAMAGTIFKDWFVDFGPTRAKIDGHEPYLAADLWALFPGKLNDVTLLPEGWTRQPVYDQADWVNGAAYKNMHFSDAPDALPVIKIAELKAGIMATTKFTNTDLGEKYRINNGDLLFSWSGNPDTSIDAFVWCYGPAWLNQHIFAVRENGKFTKAHLYFMLKEFMPMFAEIARNKQTTGLGHVTKADMQRLLICMGSEQIVQYFEEIVQPIFARIVSNLFESRSLAETRDLLLPKLISGELRLRDVEKNVGEAL